MRLIILNAVVLPLPLVPINATNSPASIFKEILSTAFLKDVRNMNPVELRRSIGYVIQQIGLMPHMTIRENIVNSFALASFFSLDHFKSFGTSTIFSLIVICGINPICIKND
jgi:ABC-type molybdate transport system ATPase subunit